MDCTEFCKHQRVLTFNFWDSAHTEIQQVLLHTADGKHYVRAGATTPEPIFGITIEDPPREGFPIDVKTSVKRPDLDGLLSTAKFRWWRLGQRNLGQRRDCDEHVNSNPSSSVKSAPNAPSSSTSLSVHGTLQLPFHQRELVAQTLEYLPLFFDAECSLLLEVYLPQLQTSPVEVLVTSPVVPFKSQLDLPDPECWLMQPANRGVRMLECRPGRLCGLKQVDMSTIELRGHDAPNVAFRITAIDTCVWRVEATSPFPEPEIEWDVIDKSALPKQFAAITLRDVGNGITRAEISPKHRSNEVSKDAACLAAISANHRRPRPSVAAEVWDDAATDSLRFRLVDTRSGTVVVGDSGVPLSWDRNGHTVAVFRFCEAVDTLDGRSCVFSYGLGGRTLMRRNGRIWQQMTRDFGSFVPGDDPLPQCHPYVTFVRPGGVDIDSPLCVGFVWENLCHSTWEFSETGHELVVTADAGFRPWRYYVIAAASPMEVAMGYARLTGTTPLPPLWAVGFHQSRWSYVPQPTVVAVADRFRETGIPCDAIWLDIDYMHDFRVFTWDPDKFPDPRGLAEYLHARGFRLPIIIDPGVKAEHGYWVFEELLRGRHYVRMSTDGDRPLVGNAWPGRCCFPDFTRSETRQWWGTLLRNAVTIDGVDGFLNDMNEPGVFYTPGHTLPGNALHCYGNHHLVHNVYGMLMGRATFEGLLRLYEEENVAVHCRHGDIRRPFVVSRAASAGAHRYGWTWTGDNRSTWGDIRMAIPMCLSLSLSGMVGVGADIGGFMFACSPELFARWILFGVFTPFCRVHAAKGSDFPEQEPWAFGEVVEEISRRAIRLRYRLLPYLYTHLWVAWRVGIPLMRPLWYDPEWCHDGACFDPQWEETEFLVGPHLLVAPVLDRGADGRDVRLPPAAAGWVDFHTRKWHPGGAVVHVDSPLDSTARPIVFVRAGAVVPMFRNEVVQRIRSTDDCKINSLNDIPQMLEFVYFAKQCSKQPENDYEQPRSHGLLYVDDGDTLAYQHGRFALYSLNENGIHERIAGKGEW